METYIDRKYVVVDLSAKVQEQLNNAANAKEERKIIYAYIRGYLRGEYCASDGRTVIINKSSADKFTNKASKIQLQAAPHLAELIETGQFITLVDVTHKKFNQFAYYDVIFKIGDTMWKGKLNIGVYENGISEAYTLTEFNPIKKEEVEPPIWAPKSQTTLHRSSLAKVNDPTSSHI